MQKTKSVIVIGGGDTGTDCIGTALCDTDANHWLILKSYGSTTCRKELKIILGPCFPRIYKVDYGHEESNDIIWNRSKSLSQFLGRSFLEDDQMVVLDWHS